MTAKGRVTIIGVGPGGAEHISLGALEAIRQEEEIWLLELGPVGYERSFVRREIEGKRVVNLYGYYLIPTCPRVRFYRLIGQRIAHLARAGRKLAMLVSGNPTYWVYMAQLLKAHAQSGEIHLRIVCSMSFLDVMYDPTPFSCMDDLQVRLGSIVNPGISPEIDCIVGQIDDARTSELANRRALRRFCKTLRDLYGARHPVYIVGHHAVDGEPLYRPVTSEGLLEAALDLTAFHYSILIPSRDHVRSLRQRTRHNRSNERLAYLRAD
jgi:hypothetical protein